MEFMLGSIFTLVIVGIFGTLMKRQPAIEKNFKPNFGQSYLNELIRHNEIQRYIKEKKAAEHNQSYNHFKENVLTRIISIDGMAYWIEKNALYQAEIFNKKILDNTKKIVDTHSMDSVELDKIQFIVSKLTEGKSYDSGSTGNI